MPDTVTAKPDSEAVLSQLKLFQRDTVEYVYRRLYADADCTRRFLVADEVGLGKTMVARGVIARAIDRLWDEVDRVDVVYICSNADIARQNLRRLNFTSDDAPARADRLTMLPATLPQLDARLNFVSFTPGTSFNLGSSTGRSEERILLYWMLDRLWGLPGEGASQVLQGGVWHTETWRRRLAGNWLPGIGEVAIQPELLERFSEELAADERRAAGEGARGLRERFLATSEALAGHYSVHDAPEDLRRQANGLTGELRGILARACLSALEPDLVILDEFQRFKELMDPETEAGELAHRLFDYADSQTEVRTLLLSATPYKMYTLHDEADDDHYRDFLQTFEFLTADRQRTGQLADALTRLRRSLYRIPSAGPDQAVACRQEVEELLRRVMVRTERARSTESLDDMVWEIRDRPPTLTATDTGRYLALQRVVRAVNGPDMIEYWKSAPYLVNFMDAYKVKNAIRDAVEAGGNRALAGELARHRDLLLSRKAIEAYEQVDPRNARLSHLVSELVDAELWRLLWMPPSLAPYRLGGAYAGRDLTRLTKRLIFSAWQVVPKTIAGLVSYEVERRIHRRFDDSAVNTHEARSAYSRLLRLDVREGRRVGMPVFTLIYPSSTLARIGAEALAEAARESGGGVPWLMDVLNRCSMRVAEALAPLTAGAPQEGRPDEAWYWAAPMLLDGLAPGSDLGQWWGRQDLASIWSGAADEGDAAGWREHVQHAAQTAEGWVPEGPPPGDLATVLALVALAGPATCSLRSLRRVLALQGQDTPHWLRDAAARAGWSYRRLFNQPEASTLIRGEYQRARGQPYWRQVLRYSADGGLSAVSDEYFHVLAESQALHNLSRPHAAGRLAEAFESSMALPASRVAWDDASDDDGRWAFARRHLRAHFAMRFGTEHTEDGSPETREDQVRAAFNSPFWPFVLASTSVGQEGLDFHPYCHAVVHWNLPANPVDMEQREGRVHRYRGHAVRKNLAARYADVGRGIGEGDPWGRLFEHAGAEDGGNGRGLVPDWNYPVEGGARIERHVPVLPFSSDALKLLSMRRSLAAYRMVFGQARQEDLVEYLMRYLSGDEIAGAAAALQVNLAPPTGRGGEHQEANQAR